MLLVKDYIKQQRKLVSNYRQHLKENIFCYAHEYRLINEIKRIDAQLLELSKMTPAQKQNFVNQTQLVINSRINGNTTY